MSRFLPLLAVLLCAISVQAGEFNKQINIGDAMPTFKGLEAFADGKVTKVSADDFKAKDIIVICVTCNHCPVANGYEERLIEFAGKYAGKVALLAVNVTDPATIDEDSFEKMVARAKENKYNFPYLSDPSQKLGKDLGAKVTPEFFVFDKNRKLVYMGVMDDKLNKPTENYLNAAVDAVLKGEKPKIQETDRAGRGCNIHYK
jgi:peroxiredoxin